MLATSLLLVAALLAAGCGSSSSSSSSTPTSSASSASATASSSSTSASSTGTNSSSAGTTASSSSAAATTSSQLGPEGVLLEPGPALAPASSTTPGTAVDGIQCAPVEQLAYHIHAHLQVYIDGQPRQIPGAIGLIAPVAQQTPYGPFYGARQCYYWLHTHTSDGIIHIESPTPNIYTLGDFFDEWRQPLGANQVGPSTGKVTAYVDGKQWTKSIRDIPLHAHAVIQLDVGTPLVPFQSVSFGTAGL